MKPDFTKFYRLLLCLMLTVTVHQVNAQVQLWGVTTKGGAHDGGTLYSYDVATQTYTNHYDFNGLFGSQSVFAGSPIQYNNKIYGIQDMGVYCFDPASGTINFYGPDPNSSGGNPVGDLTLLNGKFYCMSGRGASGSSIMEYDPASNILTDKYDMDVNNDGAIFNDSSSGYSNAKLVVYNGKLYGLAKSGGTTDLFGQTYNILGTLFEYDPAASSGNGFTKKMDFGTVASGHLYYSPLGGLTLYNGLLYGICMNVESGDGELFSYDPNQTGTAGFSERHDFGADNDGSGQFQSWNGLLTVYNDKLYGTKDAGGTTNTGLIYAYDPNSGQYEKIYDNPNATLESFSGVTASGNQLYGVNELGSFIYKLDPLTNARTTLYTLPDGSPNGYHPTNELLAIPLAAAPVITFDDFPKTYGDAAFTPAATSTDVATPITYSIADGDNSDNVIALAADGKVTILKPGIAYITASQAATPLASTPVRVKLTVNKALLTVNAKDQTLVTNQPITDLPFEYQGWVGTDSTVPDLITGKPVLTTTAIQGSPVGTYPITVLDISGLISANYTFAAGTGATLTINATGSTPQTITFALLPAATYGDADIALTAATDANGLTVNYASSNANVATIVNGKLHLVGAGTATITATQAGNATYAPAADQSQTLTINPATLTITADNQTINRGDLIPELTATYAGFVNGDDASKLTVQPIITTAATAVSAPGVYIITVSDAASPNYAITFDDGKLTIKGTQLITWTPISTLTYGDAPFDPGAVSDAGAAFTPVYTTSNPSVISLSGGQATIKGAGSAIIMATFAAGNGFELTTGTLTVTIQKKQLVITADDKSRSYGEADPVFTFTYNGFVNSDNAGSGALTALPTATSTSTTTSPVGNYLVTPGSAQSNNYEPVYLTGNLQIKPVARTLTFNALPAKAYGDADFNPAATASTAEQVTYTIADPAVASVTSSGQIHLNGAGTTTITATLPANASYTGSTIASQTLTVSKVPLTISADNKTITQNSGDPLLTVSFSGFVNGDNQLNLATRPLITTTGKSNSATGTYPIIVNGAASPNYDILYMNGTLTVVFGVGQDQLVVHPMLSPNGDGKNDYLLIDGIQNYPDNHVLVVNRNGAKVYEGKGYDNSSIVFSGKNNDGNSLVAGTYYYEINYTLKGNSQRKTGYIIIKY